MMAMKMKRKHCLRQQLGLKFWAIKMLWKVFNAEINEESKFPKFLP